VNLVFERLDLVSHILDGLIPALGILLETVLDDAGQVVGKLGPHLIHRRWGHRHNRGDQ